MCVCVREREREFVITGQSFWNGSKNACYRLNWRNWMVKSILVSQDFVKCTSYASGRPLNGSLSTPLYQTQLH